MLQKTKGIVLRSVKYGDTSLISTVFTQIYGVQTYLVQGVRSEKSRGNKAALLQPTTMLDMVVYQRPHKNMQRIREYHPAYIYQTLHEEIVKNSIAIFSVEVLLRLLPEHAPVPEIFDLAFEYLQQLDKRSGEEIANYPLFFLVQCGELLGYKVAGNYGAETPYISLSEGAFTHMPPKETTVLTQEDISVLGRIMEMNDINEWGKLKINASMRYKMLEWYMEFLHTHTQHFGNIKSLSVLRAVLH